MYNNESIIKCVSQGGNKELDAQYFEKNQFADAVLETVLKHGGSRRIILSTFEYDIAVM